MLWRTAELQKERLAFLTQNNSAKVTSTLPFCAAQFYECRLLPSLLCSQKNFSQSMILASPWRLPPANKRKTSLSRSSSRSVGGISGTTLGGVTARGSKQGMQFFSQAQNSHPLGDVAKEVRKQEPVFLPGGHGPGADIQPDDLAGFGVSLDREVSDSTPSAKPVSDGAREGTERVAGEGLASHHLMAGTSQYVVGSETQQAFSRLSACPARSLTGRPCSTTRRCPTHRPTTRQRRFGPAWR